MASGVNDNNPKNYMDVNRKLKLAIAILSLAALCNSAMAQDNSTDYLKQNADYWYKRGLDLAGTGLYEKAVQAYDTAIAYYPDHAGAWNSKAAVLSSLSMSEHNASRFNQSLQAYDRAIELYDAALQADPQDVNTWYYKGLALSDRAAAVRAGVRINMSGDEKAAEGYYEEAIRAYSRAVEINPNYVTAWKNIGNVLYSLGRYNESLAAYDKAIEIVPSYPLAWYNKGLVQDKLGRYDEAVKSYDKAIEKDSKNAEIWFHKGNALFAQELYNEAVNCYEKAIKLNQSFALAWHQKGAAFEKLGFDIGAKAAYAKASYLGYKA
jgi:tetratricopeptide (TPR) repeat protein